MRGLLKNVFRFALGSKEPKTRKPKPQEARLAVESLEERELLSATPGISGSAASGHVYIIGSEGDDLVTVRCISKGRIRVTFSNGETGKVQQATFRAGSINTVTFEGRGGDDEMRKLCGPCSVFIGGEGGDTSRDVDVFQDYDHADDTVYGSNTSYSTFDDRFGGLFG